MPAKSRAQRALKQTGGIRKTQSRFRKLDQRQDFLPCKKRCLRFPRSCPANKKDPARIEGSRVWNTAALLEFQFQSKLNYSGRLTGLYDRLRLRSRDSLAAGLSKQSRLDAR